MDRRSALALLLGLVSVGCKRSSGMRSPPTLDARHEPLRARFESDVGMTRLLVLASPT
jgi:hypothetical protein